MAHFTYILKSLKDGRFYVGYTTDVSRRLAWHNAGLQRSTRHRIPFELVWTERHEDRRTALARERQIKRWKGGRALKKFLELQVP